jgi:hypothetical protein
LAQLNQVWSRGPSSTASEAQEPSHPAFMQTRSSTTRRVPTADLAKMEHTRWWIE